MKSLLQAMLCFALGMGTVVGLQTGIGSLRVEDPVQDQGHHQSHAEQTAAVTEASETNLEISGSITTSESLVHTGIDSPEVRPTASRTSLPVGQWVRVVDGTGWIAEGELRAVDDRWVHVLCGSGREMFVATTPATMIEIIEPGSESFVSVTTRERPPQVD